MRCVNSLDPLTLPLRGLQLIEASAGTGKTYTIATLYLRLLLSGLAIDGLLVVTYTNAAVEELRERIRRRVVEALASLESGATGEGQDPVLGDLLRGLEDAAGARVLLAEAVTRMDEAAIYTIHGFCQRALQEHAFESGAPFESEFLTEEETLRREIGADFWRRRVAAMDAEGAAWVCAQWSNPSRLLAEISDGLTRDDLRLLPEAAVISLEAAEQRRAILFEEMRALWGGGRSEVVEILASGGALNRRSYNKSIVSRAVTAMDELMARSQAPEELPRDCDRFTPALLTEKTMPDRSPPAHPFFDLCGELSELVETLAGLRRAAFLTEARAYVRTELDRRKAAASQLFFDDLLRRLDAALGGAGGEVLARKLRERYPVALIDEFQDTDPVAVLDLPQALRGPSRMRAAISSAIPSRPSTPSAVRTSSPTFVPDGMPRRRAPNIPWIRTGARRVAWCRPSTGCSSAPRHPSFTTRIFRSSRSTPDRGPTTSRFGSSVPSRRHCTSGFCH